MLSKDNRLVTDTQIKNGYRTKFQYKNSHCKFYLSPTEDLNFRLLVVISKKVYKKANKRNRCKRKVYAMYESLKSNNRLPKNIDCIVQIQNKNLLNLKQDDLLDAVVKPVSQLYKKLLDSQLYRNGKMPK